MPFSVEFSSFRHYKHYLNTGEKKSSFIPSSSFLLLIWTRLQLSLVDGRVQYELKWGRLLCRYRNHFYKTLFKYRCSGYPGIFGDPARNCMFFNTKLYEDMNAKLRFYLQSTRKNIPNVDPKLLENNGGQMMLMTPAQIKQESYQQQAQIKQEMFQEQMAAIATTNPALMMVPPPKIINPMLQQSSQAPSTSTGAPLPFVFNANCRVFQLLDKNIAVAENQEQNWKCLIFLDHVMSPVNMARDIRVTFPLNTMVNLNAKLINPDKSIQYIATLAWDPKVLPNPGNTMLMQREITDEQFMKYYDILSTVGRVLDTVSKLGLQQKKEGSKAKSDTIVAIHGTVDKILDDNFGLLKIDQGLVLFDTCDFWIGPLQTAAKANKVLKDVVQVGDAVLTNACLILKESKIPFLATAVWSRNNPVFVNPATFPPPIFRDNVYQEKIDIYKMVVDSIAASIDSQTTHEVIDPKHVLTWRHAIVKAVFSDKSWNSHGSLSCGIVLIDDIGYAFFMSNNFSRVDTVPAIGMEEFVNAYPTAELPEGHQLGGMAYICTNLYSPFMKGACMIPTLPKLKAILQESSEKLISLLSMYPRLQNPAEFIR